MDINECMIIINNQYIGQYAVYRLGNCIGIKYMVFIKY